MKSREGKFQRKKGKSYLKHQYITIQTNSPPMSWGGVLLFIPADNFSMIIVIWCKQSLLLGNFGYFEQSWQNSDRLLQLSHRNIHFMIFFLYILNWTKPVFPYSYTFMYHFSLFRVKWHRVILNEKPVVSVENVQINETSVAHLWQNAWDNLR